MPALIDITGQRFGRLTVFNISREASKKHVYWRCRCDCGTRLAVDGSALRNGHTQSCGCRQSEAASRTQRRHGHAINGGSRMYQCWLNMIARCYNKNGTYYRNYGGRGITVCKRWRKFENFLADMGERPAGRSLDRINNDQGYSPANCRWATRSEQNKNKRRHALPSMSA
jgi:hypothetical protein